MPTKKKKKEHHPHLPSFFDPNPQGFPCSIHGFFAHLQATGPEVSAEIWDALGVALLAQGRPKEAEEVGKWNFKSIKTHLKVFVKV